MRKHIILHIISGILIVVLLTVGFTWKNDIIELTETNRHKDEELFSLQNEIIESNALLDANNSTIDSLKTENDSLLGKLEDESYLKDYNTIRYYHLNRSSYLRGTLIKSLSNELLEYKKDYHVIYGSDDQAEHTELAYIIDPKSDLDLKGQLDWIAENLMNYSFAGYIIDVIEIEEIDGKKIAHIDLKEPENQEHGWSVNFFMGSSQGSITAEILIESFLQKEIESPWIDGVYFSYEGNRDWITDHDPALCRYIYFRDGTSIEDVK